MSEIYFCTKENVTREKEAVLLLPFFSYARLSSRSPVAIVALLVALFNLYI